jgi:hypothetical protein
MNVEPPLMSSMISNVPRVVSLSSVITNFVTNCEIWHPELFSTRWFVMNQKSINAAPPKLEMNVRPSPRMNIMETSLSEDYGKEELASIINVCITDTYTMSYQMKDPCKVLEEVECLKNKKYLHPCIDQWHHFTSFVVSVDGIFGKEANKIMWVPACCKYSNQCRKIVFKRSGLYESAYGH